MTETKLTFDSFPNEDQARTDSSKAGGGDRRQLESVTLRWADDDHGPMLYTNSKITMWIQGKSIRRRIPTIVSHPQPRRSHSAVRRLCPS